jgi:hypothetical protein
MNNVILASVLVLLLIYLIYVNYENFDVYYNHDRWVSKQKELPLEEAEHWIWSRKVQDKFDLFNKYYQTILYQSKVPPDELEKL